jgi:hypothetical protein
MADSTHAPMWPSVGQYVRSKFPGDVFSIWMIHHQGFQSGTECKEPCPVDQGALHAGQLLAPLGKQFYAKTSDLLQHGIDLDRRLNIAVNDNGSYSGNIARNTEAVFFVDRVSPLRTRHP